MAGGRRTVLWVALAVVGVMAVLTVIGAVADNEDGGTPTPAGSEEAGCLAVEKTTPTPPGGKHRTGVIEYADAPPHSGEHSPNTLRTIKRFYTPEDNPPVEQAVHDLEHGLVVAWYDASLPAADVAALKELAPDLGRFVAVPWTRSTFDGDRHFVLTAWGVRQRCAAVSADHVRDFVKEYADTDAPEKGYSV